MPRDLTRSILDDLRRTWPQLLATDLLYKLAATIVIAPLAGLVLRGIVAFSGDAAITDLDILDFVLSPVGIVGLTVVAGIGVAVFALEQTCLMTISFGAARDARVSTKAALIFGLRRALPVLRVSLRAVALALRIAAPFLIADGLVFLFLLTDVDINYYLTQRPPKLWIAAALIATLTVMLLAVLLPRVIGWTFALPLVLFEDISPSKALRTSTERAFAHRGTIILAVISWAAGMGLLYLGVGTAIVLLADWIVPDGRGSITVLATALGVVVLMWSAANLAMAIVQEATLAALITRLYDRFGASESARLAPWIAAAEESPSSAWRLSTGKTLAAAASAAVVAIAIGAWLVHGVRPADDVVVIAHRGAAAAAPENTLAAVERAIADGTDMVEIDVQETADGAVAVAHDKDFMRVAGVDLELRNATADRLRDIDVGSWFGAEFSDERTPLLADVLERCKGKVKVVIELKYYGHQDRLEERVIEIVEAADMASEILIMSLGRLGVRKTNQLRPDWTVGVLAATAVGDLSRLDADFLAISVRMANRTLIRRAHRRGRDVYVWTVNDAVTMSRMISLGVDGLITDDPALARSVLAQRAELDVVQRLLLNFSRWFGAVPAKAASRTLPAPDSP